MKVLFFVSCMVFSFASWGHDLEMKTYLKMQEALAKDDMATALAAHKEICAKELDHYKDSYKDCDKNFKTIDELRDSFKMLSKVFIENGNKATLKKLTTAECSMAKAKWVQTPGTLRNPYYGKSMLTCGEKI